MNRILRIFFLVSFLILANASSALCKTSEPIICVSGDGSGDFDCDGKDDHVQINQALKFVAENSGYTTVYLKGPFTYFIDDTLLIGSNTILEGDSSAKIKLVSNAKWETSKPMIKERGPDSHDIIIRGFTIDGNRDENMNVESGKGYYNLIHFSDCRNISVYDMCLANNHGDGLKTDSCSNIRYYDNKIYGLGHDALYASSCSDVEAYNNIVTCRTNSALRLYNTNHASLYNNTITSENAGGAGIEIQKYGTPAMDDIEVYNNTIYRTALSGIWIFGSGPSYSLSSANVHIHHNRIYDTGTKTSSTIAGGIVSSGFNALVENNVFDGCYGSAISQKETYSAVPGSGYAIKIRNNIITNTRFSSAGGKGYGIYNLLTGTHFFVLQNNCFYNNKGGNYKGVGASPSDIEGDPYYFNRNKNDYHLKSKSGRWDGSIWVNDNVSSPCIDAGYKLSDYSAEPEDNGNRINIGLYGNTKYASKSGNSISIVENKSSIIEKNNSLILSGKMYDNRLREVSPNEVFSNKEFLDVGGMKGGRYRDLTWFNVSEYTSSDEISSAVLSLFWYYPSSSRPNDTVIEIYRPASVWDPSSVSWSKKNNLTSWKNSGGDWYDKNGILQGSAPYATLTLKASDLPDNRYYQLNVTDLLKEYIRGKYANTGFLIKARNENNNYVAFYSSECGNVSLKPKLDIKKKETSNPTSNSIINTTIGVAKDNRLRESSPEDVFSDKAFLDAGEMKGGRYRDLMLFNLSAYKGATQVRNATLSLCWYYPASSRVNDTVIEIYRPASAWNSSYVSWNKKNNGIFWNNSGGDWYDKNGVLQGSTPYATLTLKASDLPDNRYYQLNVTGLVNEYLSRKYANTGFLVKARSENNNYIAFYSADCGNASQAPKLNIEKRL
ncbi:disaggregatase related repeat-containing protein [Methanosarcina sp.]|uniref:disaggregatase related repeat-containing protein n=1 Tax=Methanosarcina sp. TaxID=2213 RepID=UPI003BB5336F